MPRPENREHRITIPFTRDQERDLKSHNGKEMTVRQLQLYFNEKYGANKSYECIRNYCVKNNISLTAKRISRARFTQSEIDYINDNNHLALKELVSNLNDVFGVNRSASGVHKLVKRLGLKKPPTDYHTYTQEHCEYLISYIGPLKNKVRMGLYRQN